IRISNCNSGSLEVDETTNDVIVTCDQFSAQDTVSWALLDAVGNTGTSSLGSCSPSTCSPVLPTLYGLSRPSSTVSQLTINLPLVSGRYYYKAVVYPGATEQLFGPVSIVRPSSPTISQCTPQGYVPDNTNVTCQCTANVGNPGGRLVWKRVSSQQDSVINTGSYGVASLEMTSQVLTRGDHDVTQFRCDVDWAEIIEGENYTARVGLEPRDTVLTINSQSARLVAVNESDSVTFRCRADGRPTPSMTLMNQNTGREITTQSSPLSHIVSRARCEDAAVYKCTARNGIGQDQEDTTTLFVNCKPRGRSEELPAVVAGDQQVPAIFDVTSYPVPDTFTFTFLGETPDSENPGSETGSGASFNVLCQRNKRLLYLVTCVILMENVTSDDATESVTSPDDVTGFYRLTMTNSYGYGDFLFRVKESFRPTSECDVSMAAAVGGGVGAGVAVVVAGVVSIVVFRRCRSHTYERPRKPKEEEFSPYTGLDLQQIETTGAETPGDYENAATEEGAAPPAMSTHYQTLGMEQDVEIFVTTMMNGAPTPGPGMALSPQAEMMRGHRSMSADFSRIDNLTSQTETEQEVYSKEITRKHWKQVDGVTRCSNRSCRKQFSLLERSHHCRRCGEIFCAACLKYRRKLNQLAHLDPQGRQYKVCKNCYEEGQSYDGCVRDITAEFAQMREQKSSSNNAKGKTRRGGGWRNRLNFDLECQRLIEGFRKSIGKSEVRRTLHELRSMMSMPDWQKSSLWLQESTAGSCQFCCEGFGLLKKRHFCKVCGLALCKSCSTTDLLVYVPDNQLHKESTGSVDTSGIDPCLAIIKIIGCPEVEPEVSLYLRVCSECREELVRRQVDKCQNEDDTPSGLDMMQELATLHEKFSTAERNVNHQLREYQEIVESLEDNSRRSNNQQAANGTPSSRNSLHSNMRTLAKAQGDLTDILADHVMVIQRLKRLVPRTEKQSHLLKNYIRAKCDFYLENMSTFRQMRAKLAESSPPEVLEFIQRVMDKNAIISAHLYLRQLVYEVIHLCDKFELQEKAPQLLVKVEGEHKLIRPSRRAVAEHGKAHVQQIMSMRVREVLDQVTLQLKLKSANRSFPATKQALGNITEILVTA
ncbi:hypothetical protein BaRGS_00029764, partial [Batillaria attramentaria]